MIRLLNTRDKTYKLTLTKNPITNPQQSPEPTGKSIDQAKNKMEENQIRSHLNYSEAEIVVLHPGINEFENEEQAEYLYRTLGDPEDAGVLPIGSNKFVNVKNKNWLFEADENGKEKKDNLFLKYRTPAGVVINTYNPDPELFKLKEEPVKA